MIQLTIDGKKVHARKGMTIIQAADAAGIWIPRLCYHKGLSPIGACRLCVVHVKPGPPRPVPACTTPVSDGMEVTTRSDQLDHYRRELLQLLLVNHPLDCPICDKGGECELQDLTRELKIADQPYAAKRLTPRYDNVSPLIERYPDRCVNCERCVRVCRDHVGAAALYFDNRGYRTTVTAGGLKMECEFCGSCIAVCPVGAIIDKTFKYKARSWQLEKTVVVCPYCGGGCHLILNLKEGRLKRVTSSFDEPVNGGILCSRGRFGLTMVEHPERVTQPLVRRDDRLIPVSWDEALDVAAAGFSGLIQGQGGECLAGLGSARATNEANYLFQKFCRLVLRTPHVDTTASLDHQKVLRAFVNVMGRPVVRRQEGRGPSGGAIREVTGFQLALGSLEDLEQADVVIFLGVDVKGETTSLAWAINRAQKEGRLKELVVVGSRAIRFRSPAHMDVRIRPGSAGFVVLGILKALFEMGDRRLRDSGDFRREATLRKRLDATQWQLVEENSGIGRSDVHALAEKILEAHRPSLVVGYDLFGTSDGYASACYVADLLLVLGKKLKVHVTAEKVNTQGCSDMGVSPYWLPGYADFQNVDTLVEVWGAEPISGPGYELKKILRQAVQGDIKAFYIMGTDLYGTSLPRSLVERALGSVDFLVCQEAFLNETARRADVVLPALTSVEVHGTLTSSEFRVQKQLGQPFVEGARPDWWIVQQLALRVGFWPKEYGSAADVFEEICQVIPTYRQYPFNDIPPEGFWWSQLHRSHYGSTAWKRKLNPMVEAAIPWLENPPMTTDDYPFLLVVTRSLFQSGTLGRYGTGPVTLEPSGAVRMNPEDLRMLGGREKGGVVLSNAGGEVAVQVVQDPKVPRHVIHAPLHFPDLPINRLTDGSTLVAVRAEVKDVPDSRTSKP